MLKNLQDLTPLGSNRSPLIIDSCGISIGEVWVSIKKASNPVFSYLNLKLMGSTLMQPIDEPW